VTDALGLFEDEEVQQQKKPPIVTTQIQEKPPEPTRAEVASKLLQDLDEWIKEGMSKSPPPQAADWLVIFVIHFIVITSVAAVQYKCNRKCQIL
jgi:hypothetical protein